MESGMESGCLLMQKVLYTSPLSKSLLGTLDLHSNPQERDDAISTLPPAHRRSFGDCS
jgi:hypothetical protein